MNYKMEEVYQLLHLPKGKNYIFLLLHFWDTYKIDILRQVLKNKYKTLI